MEIRLARKSDLNSIDEIYNQAIEMKMATADTVGYSKSEREEWYNMHDNSSFPVYVACKDDIVIGYLTLSPYRPRREALKYAVEVSYFVEENMRGKGVGTTMLDFAIKLANRLRYKYILAILLGHNEASIRLLKKFGFAEWGLMPGIAEFDGKSYDHLFYGLDISSPHSPL